jgi:PTS system mannitol-specific IIA component
MAELLQQAGIVLDATASSREEAVALCGTVLLTLGAITPEYRDAMWEREQIFPSEIGNGFAIPHGTDESRKHVIFDQLVFIRLATPIRWVDEEVSVVIGIASAGDGHVEILGNLADILLEEEHADVLLSSPSAEAIRELIVKGI